MKRKAIVSLTLATVLLFATLTQLQGIWSTSPLFGAPAAAQSQRGPRIDKLRYKVTRSPAAQLIEMTTGPPSGSDIWGGMIRPSDIEGMDVQGKTISSRAGFHLSYFGMNYRRYPLSDVNFRHAIAHLVPKDSIIGSLFKYVVVKVDTPMPPALSLWYNPGVDPHPYSPIEAEAVLAAAGYQKVSGVWKDKDGTNLPTLQFYVPLEVVAPTSYTIGMMLAEEAQAIGLTNFVLQPMDFATYHSLVYDDWDFDIYWEERVLGTYPDFLYDIAHSDENYLGSNNPAGINWPELDTELATLKFSHDFRSPASVSAANRSQELLMGGTSSSPLAKPAPVDMQQALPYIPVYSQNYYDAAQPQLAGLVNMFGSGTDNEWTCMNMHWNTPNEYRPSTSERTIVWIEKDYPERLNPLWAPTVYAWDYMEGLYDGLIATSPYMLLDEPWLATDWSYETGPDGMNVTFNLRLTDSEGQPVKWQDGKAISVNDVKFSWDFLSYWQIPRYWTSFRFYDPVNTVIVDADTIRAHMNAVSQEFICDLSNTAFMFPPQVWTQNPYTGAPWTNAAEILGFDPSAYSYPLPGNVNPGSNALPTQLFGTGPFVLQHSTSFIGTHGYGDLNANRNYWLTTTQIHDVMVSMFHRAGDVNYDGIIDLNDLSLAVLAYGTSIGEPGWDPDVDLNGDNVVDICDTIPVGMNYGETRTIPNVESYDSLTEPLEETPYYFTGGSPTPASPSATTIYVEPTDTVNDTLQSGAYLSLSIDIADVVDLMGYDFRLTFNSSILNAVSVTAGGFVASPAVWRNVRNNEAGFVWFAASGRGSRYGVSGSGRLAVIQFVVTGYGKTSIELKGFTKLGDSRGQRVTHIAIDGYFENRILGDVDYDKAVNVHDLRLLGKAYASDPESPNWNEEADFDRNNIINDLDLALLCDNYGRRV